jgi:hypothetical protein
VLSGNLFPLDISCALQSGHHSGNLLRALGIHVMNNLLPSLAYVIKQKSSVAGGFAVGFGILLELYSNNSIVFQLE